MRNQQKDGQRQRRPKILIIDDDVAISQQLFWALCDDFEVLTARDLISALRLAERYEPEIYILDLCLPPIVHSPEVGLYILGHLRQKLPASKILVVSSAANSETHQRCVQNGATAVFKKPLDLELFLQALRRHSTQDLSEH